MIYCILCLAVLNLAGTYIYCSHRKKTTNAGKGISSQEMNKGISEPQVLRGV